MRSRETASVVCGAVTLAAAVLAVGGALRWTAALVAILLTLTLIPAVWSRRGLSGTSPLIVIIGMATVFTAIQLIPLPDWIGASLDPVNERLRQDAALAHLLDVTSHASDRSVIGTGVGLATPGWHPLTLDPPGTLRALTYFITLLGVAVFGLRLAANERGRLFCLGAVASICAITAGIVGIHEMFDAETLYGIYTPEQATPPVLGPLLNGNHLGGLMALGATLAVGLFIYAKQSMVARVVWALTGVGCTIVVLASLSRGAVLALASGVGVTLGTYVAQRLAKPAEGQLGSRSRRRKFVMSSLPIGIVAVCVLVLIVYTSAGTVADQLSNTSLQEISEPRSKFAAWKSSQQLVEETPWVGVGRGALEPAFTRVHSASAFVTFSHLENEYIEAVVDWGIPAAIALAIALGWLVIVAAKRWRDGPLVAAALGGVTTAAVQSNVDFGLELLGLAVPLVLVAATLVWVPLRPMRRADVAKARALRLAHLVVIVAAAIVLCLPITTTVAEDHVALDQQQHPPLADIRESIERHPLDYFSYAVAAEALTKEGNPGAVPLLSHALVLHPTHPGLHRFAGALLSTTHPDQAAIEYQFALHGTRDPKQIIAEIVARFPPERVAEAIPLDYDNLDLVIHALDQQKRNDVALTWISRVVEARPKSVAAIDEMAALAQLRLDWKAAEKAARLKVEVMPTSTNAKVALGKLLARREAHKEVLALFSDVTKWHGRVDDIADAWMMVCDAYFKLKELEQASKCLHELDASGNIMPGSRSGILHKLKEVNDLRREIILVPEDAPKKQP